MGSEVHKPQSVSSKCRWVWAILEWTLFVGAGLVLAEVYSHTDNFLWQLLAWFGYGLMIGAYTHVWKDRRYGF